MKNSLVFTIAAFLFILQSCNSKGDPYDSEWVTQKYIINEEHNCDCTEKEKEDLKKINHYKIEQNLEKFNKLNFLKFNSDYTMNGAVMGKKVSGTYITTPGEIYLKLDDEKEKTRLQIYRMGGEEFLIINLPETDLETYSESYNHPKYGEVKVIFNELKILLEKSK